LDLVEFQEGATRLSDGKGTIGYTAPDLMTGNTTGKIMSSHPVWFCMKLLSVVHFPKVSMKNDPQGVHGASELTLKESSAAAQTDMVTLIYAPEEIIPRKMSR
jgi:hypothetical protein